MTSSAKTGWIVERPHNYFGIELGRLSGHSLIRGDIQNMKSVKKYLVDQPIRLKMFYAYSIIVVMTVVLVGFSVYLQVSKSIKQNIENLLSNATSVSLKMVETTAQASIKNYLRAVAEKNLQIIERYYQDVQEERMTKQEAISRLRGILFS